MPVMILNILQIVEVVLAAAALFCCFMVIFYALKVN